MDPASLALLALVTFAGSLVQAALGFGFAILAAPLFLVVMDSTGAVPVLAVLNLAASAWVAARTWRQAPVRLLGLLVAGSLAGLPVGLAVYRLADVETLKVVAGFVIMLLAITLLARERGHWPVASAPTAQAMRPAAAGALLVGLVAGVMAAALAMPGPAAMLFLAGRRLPRDASRALSLGFFTVVYAAVSLLHAWDGGLTGERWRLIAGLLAFVVAGAVAGQALARRIPEARFRELVLLILFLAGFYAVLAA